MADRGEYHEPWEQLSQQTRELHRALVSLIEELEAVDWYQQRADVCEDESLRKILVHNRDEEVEHAMMTLEWIRRHDSVFDHEARTYLFAEGDITEAEEQQQEAGQSDADGGSAGGLGLGGLEKGKEG